MTLLCCFHLWTNSYCNEEVRKCAIEVEIKDNEKNFYCCGVERIKTLCLIDSLLLFFSCVVKNFHMHTKKIFENIDDIEGRCLMRFWLSRTLERCSLTVQFVIQFIVWLWMNRVGEDMTSSQMASLVLRDELFFISGISLFIKEVLWMTKRHWNGCRVR